MSVDRDNAGGQVSTGVDDPADETFVAIIGMAGRFPGAPDLEHFWRNLAGGVESLRHFTDEELLEAGESAAALRDPSYVRACPFLDASGKRCSVYEARPFGCRTFFCGRINGPSKIPADETNALLERLTALNVAVALSRSASTFGFL